MATITADELADLIKQTPTYIASVQEGANMGAHQATGFAGMNIALSLRNAGETKDAIGFFLEQEKAYLTAYGTRESQKIAARKICDEIRGILRGRGVEIPDRDETGWVTSAPSSLLESIKWKSKPRSGREGD